MTKKLLVLVLAFSLVFANSAFAFRWFVDGDDWFVIDEAKGEFLESILLDTGDNVYFLDSTGKMVTGWWRNSESGNYYFFSNKKDKDYGGMVFGLHVVDGYYRYFNDDGTLAVSHEKGSYKNVFGEYYADTNGLLYLNNELQRDVSIMKSEFYTNPVYYNDPLLNNYFLATYDTNFTLFEVEPAKDSSGNEPRDGKSRIKTGSDTNGGTNYYVDERGGMHVMETEVELSEFERRGPSVHVQ